MMEQLMEFFETKMISSRQLNRQMRMCIVQPNQSAVVPNVNKNQRTLNNVLKAFDEYCIPKKKYNITMESFKFNNIVQKEKQPFVEFEIELNFVSTAAMEHRITSGC